MNVLCDSYKIGTEDGSYKEQEQKVVPLNGKGYLSTYLSTYLTNVGAEGNSVAATFYTITREVPVSNTGHDTGYPDRELSWFFSVTPGKFLDSTLTRPRPFPSKSFSIYHSTYHCTKHSA